MSPRFARLIPDWLMRGWSDAPFAVLNWRTGDLRQAEGSLAHVIRGCDGQTDFHSLLFLPTHRRLLDALIAQGIAEACAPGDGITQVQKFRLAANPYLRGVHWSITGRCNLKCRHCYMEAPDQRYPDLGEAEIHRIIAQFERVNAPQVSLTGGEPFLRKDLFHILEQLVEKRIRVHQIYSNGLLITDAVLGKIQEIGLSPDFNLSFDGCGTHDAMRGVSGTESRVLQAIQRLRDAGFAVNIATSIDRSVKSNQGLLDTYTQLKALSIRSWQVAPPNRTGNWRTADTHLSLEEEIALYAPLLQQWREDGQPFHLQMGAFFNSRLEDVSSAEQPAKSPGYTPDSFDCGVCRLSPYLLPDGVLLPCHGFTDTPLPTRMPNLLEQEFSEIWTASALVELARARKSVRLVKNPECAQCAFFAQCGMGCPARALLETGDITAKDPLACQLWQRHQRP
ncbi:MAG: hypothetical protein QG599_2709 [Pseudomonadota bacterium]|nr:hypothetical protein [Pseudomonadota bacterium]